MAIDTGSDDENRATWRSTITAIVLILLHSFPALALELQSTAFTANTEIPVKYTCKGQDVSPPLTWSDPPKATKTFVLIVDDPDAPDPAAPTHTFVHWVVYNLPATTTALAEGGKPLPPVARDGTNDRGRGGYTGPCPPIGGHRYFFKLYALDNELADLATPTKAAIEKAMAGHVVGEAQLIGTFQK